MHRYTKLMSVKDAERIFPARPDFDKMSDAELETFNAARMQECRNAAEDFYRHAPNLRPDEPPHQVHRFQKWTGSRYLLCWCGAVQREGKA